MARRRQVAGRGDGERQETGSEGQDEAEAGRGGGRGIGMQRWSARTAPRETDSPVPTRRRGWSRPRTAPRPPRTASRTDMRPHLRSGGVGPCWDPAVDAQPDLTRRSPAWLPSDEPKSPGPATSPTGSGTVSAVSSGAFTDLPVSWAARTESSDGRRAPRSWSPPPTPRAYAMAFSGRARPGRHAARAAVRVGARSRSTSSRPAGR